MPGVLRGPREGVMDFWMGVVCGVLVVPMAGALFCAARVVRTVAQARRRVRALARAADPSINDQLRDWLIRSGRAREVIAMEAREEKP